jgi:DNA-binding NarL/FixJ family response regulator
MQLEAAAEADTVGTGGHVGRVRVLIADDHPLIIKGVREALEGERDIDVVGEASTGAQVLPLVERASPDVVLLDLRFPDGDGFTILDQILEAHPQVKVAMLSVVNDPAKISEALERGACAYIVKSIDASDLAAALRQAMSGTFYCIGDLRVEDSARAKVESALSGREVEVLQGVARGLSNRAIARELWLSDQTVKFHLHNVYRKLGVSNRTEAAKYAFDHGLAEAFV